MRAALHWSTAAGDEEEGLLGLRLAGALGWFWHFRGYWNEGRGWLTHLLAHTTGATPAHAKAFCSAGVLAWAQTDFAAATGSLRSGLELLPSSTPTAILAHTQGILGIVLLYEWQLDQAQSLFAQSLAHFRQLGDPFGTGVTMIRLAILARLQSNWEAATELCNEALQLLRQLNHEWGIGVALATLGEIALDQHDWQQAARCYSAALVAIQATGSQWYLALILVGVASVASQRGEAENAARLIGSADALLTTMQGRIPSIDRLLYERTMNAIRTALDHAHFATAYAEGQRAPASGWQPWVADALR
jgi:non-specific serine/threonine protein kinase